jgi:hypothetical protein
MDWRRAMSAFIEDGRGRTVAEFANREEALLCLAAMASILRAPLRLRGGKMTDLPVPAGCVGMTWSEMRREDRDFGLVVARP